VVTQLDCACLVSLRGDRLLLVRVRDNEKWYLPGGKIEQGETPEGTLLRELREELRIDLSPLGLRHVAIVEGPAYGQAGTVRLNCYETSEDFDPVPSSEISECAWLGPDHFPVFAPAVQILYRDVLGAGTR
jgi:8-oxo-dGTP pyrophosphatase MutT (NUDIX family)